MDSKLRFQLEISKFIKEKINDLELNKSYVAKKTGLSGAYLTKITAGERLPSAKILHKIVQLFNLEGGLREENKIEQLIEKYNQEYKFFFYVYQAIDLSKENYEFLAKSMKDLILQIKENKKKKHTNEHMISKLEDDLGVDLEPNIEDVLRQLDLVMAVKNELYERILPIFSSEKSLIKVPSALPDTVESPESLWPH